MAQAAKHVGGGTAGGDPHQAVARGEPGPLQIFPAGLAQILQALGAAQQRRSSTSQHALHQAGITAEGGRALRRIEHAETARGPRPQEEEAATSRQPCGNRVHRSGELG